jgi:hypothetical protein
MPAEEPFTGRVHQTQGFAWIECKQRNIHLFDYALEQGCRFNRANAMCCQQIGQHVHFERELAKSVVGNRQPCAKGIVLFPQSAGHIGQRLQGTII